MICTVGSREWGGIGCDSRRRSGVPPAISWRGGIERSRLCGGQGRKIPNKMTDFKNLLTGNHTDINHVGQIRATVFCNAPSDAPGFETLSRWLAMDFRRAAAGKQTPTPKDLSAKGAFMTNRRIFLAAASTSCYSHAVQRRRQPVCVAAGYEREGTGGRIGPFTPRKFSQAVQRWSGAPRGERRFVHILAATFFYFLVFFKALARRPLVLGRGPTAAPPTRARIQLAAMVTTARKGRRGRRRKTGSTIAPRVANQDT